MEYSKKGNQRGNQNSSKNYWQWKNVVKDKLKKNSIIGVRNYVASSCIKVVQRITWHSPGNNQLTVS